MPWETAEMKHNYNHHLFLYFLLAKDNASGFLVKVTFWYLAALHLYFLKVIHRVIVVAAKTVNKNYTTAFQHILSPHCKLSDESVAHTITCFDSERKNKRGYILKDITRSLVLHLDFFLICGASQSLFNFFFTYQTAGT